VTNAQTVPVADESAAPEGADSYHEAVTAATEADREYATEIGGHMITTVKLFAALKVRLQSLPDADQWAIPLLHRLAHGPAQRASDLADGFGSDPSTISRQVAAMVKSGLVERQADPDDGRASILVVTPAGLERIAEHNRLRGQMMAPLVADWSPEEREMYLHLTQRFNESLANCIEPMKESAVTFFLGRSGRRENNEH